MLSEPGREYRLEVFLYLSPDLRRMVGLFIFKQTSLLKIKNVGLNVFSLALLGYN